MEPSAQSASVRVDPKHIFKIEVTAEQVQLLLNVLREAHFKGSECELAANTIRAIQEPVLLQAHGAKSS